MHTFTLTRIPLPVVDKNSPKNFQFSYKNNLNLQGKLPIFDYFKPPINLNFLDRFLLSHQITWSELISESLSKIREHKKSFQLVLSNYSYISRSQRPRTSELWLNYYSRIGTRQYRILCVKTTGWMFVEFVFVPDARIRMVKIIKLYATSVYASQLTNFPNIGSLYPF